jgi:hypothetical protein
VDEEFEIFGQPLTGSGTARSFDFRISDIGPNGDTVFDAFSPAVAYNSSDNEYLVVWSGDDGAGALVDGENEIYGQRVSATTFAQAGVNDFRISDMGSDGDSFFAAAAPAVTYNSTNNEYLVVWHGTDDVGPLVVNEYEVFGQAGYDRGRNRRERFPHQRHGSKWKCQLCGPLSGGNL